MNLEEMTLENKILKKTLNNIISFHGVSRDMYRDVDGKLYLLDVSPIKKALKKCEGL